MAVSEARTIIEYEPLFGGWHAVRRIGSGAAGSVYEIERDDDYGVTLRSAMKVISIPAGGEEEIKAARFSGMTEVEIREFYKAAADKVFAELDMMQNLRGCRNIVRYEENDVRRHDDGIGWDILVRMELLTPMLDYFDDLTRGANSDLSENEVIRMGIDLCKGLEVCRKHDIVHRDIKPANIFVGDNGDFKLGDFGIARIIEETQTSFSRKGTYTYMAPEVYSGEPYGHTADIYSLGMVLYLCLNDGRNIFVPAFPSRIDIDDHEKAFARRIAGKASPPPRHGTEELKAIVLKACAYSKNDRYQSASELRADLEALQNNDVSSIIALKAGDTAGNSNLPPCRSTDGSLPDRNQGKPDPKTHNRYRTIIAVVLTAVLALAGLLFVKTFPWEIESINVSSEGMDLGSGTEIFIGDDFEPDYIIKPEHYEDTLIEFASSDESVFTVNEEGMITAQGLGSAELSMTAKDHSKDGFTGKFSVTVEPKITSITMIDSENRVADDEISMNTGTTEVYEVNLHPAKFSNEELTCKVKDDSVVKLTVQNTGDGPAGISLEALRTGETTISLSAGGYTIKKKIKVTDPPVVYNNYTTGNNNKSSKKTNTRKSSNNPSKGEFGDYEYFD